MDAGGGHPPRGLGLLLHSVLLDVVKERVEERGERGDNGEGHEDFRLTPSDAAVGDDGGDAEGASEGLQEVVEGFCSVHVVVSFRDHSISEVFENVNGISTLR